MDTTYRLATVDGPVKSTGAIQNSLLWPNLEPLHVVQFTSFNFRTTQDRALKLWEMIILIMIYCKNIKLYTLYINYVFNLALSP